MSIEKISGHLARPTFMAVTVAESYLFAIMSKLEFSGKIQQYSNIGEPNHFLNGLFYLGTSIVMGIGCVTALIDMTEQNILRSLESIKLD